MTGKTNAYKERRATNPRKTPKPTDWRTRRLPFKASRWAYQTRVKLERLAEAKWRGTTESWRLEERQAIACFRTLPSVAELAKSAKKEFSRGIKPVDEVARIPSKIFGGFSRKSVLPKS